MFKWLTCWKHFSNSLNCKLVNVVRIRRCFRLLSWRKTFCGQTGALFRIDVGWLLSFVAAPNILYEDCKAKIIGQKANETDRFKIEIFIEVVWVSFYIALLRNKSLTDVAVRLPLAGTCSDKQSKLLMNSYSAYLTNLGGHKTRCTDDSQQQPYRNTTLHQTVENNSDVLDPSMSRSSWTSDLPITFDLFSLVINLYLLSCRFLFLFSFRINKMTECGEHI